MNPTENSPSNTGHGHVFPRPDGVRFRCGGPGRCAACNEDALRALTTAGQAQESYEGVIDCRTCVHIGPMKDCTAPVACAGGAGFERRSALQLWRCTKCGGTMAPGVAMGQTVTGELDFPGDRHPVTLCPGGPGRQIGCMKCAACGHSVYP